MHPFKKLLQSELVQLILALAGLGGVIKLIDLALPAGSEAGRWMAISYFAIVVLCVTIYILSKLIRWPLDKFEGAYRSYAERYGIGYESLSIDCTIHSDGSAEVKRTVQAVAHSSVSQFETALVIPERPPPGETWGINSVRARSLTEGRTVAVEQTEKDDGRLSTKIIIAPQLNEGDHLGYELEERLPPGLYAIDRTPEELAKRETPNDYFGWNINRPTRRLLLNVYYPVAVKPVIFDLEVRYASVAPGMPSEELQREEQRRLKRPVLEGPQGGRYTLKLDVPYPMVGLIYILRWKPVPKTP